MISLFQRKRPPVAVAPSPAPATDLPKGLMRPESAASLLATPRRQKLLEHIWQRTSLSRRQFATLYRMPLERYAELVQAFPASEAHHHAYPGGMLDHGLEIVAYSLKLRQSHLLPIGASPEDQAAQAEAWTAAVAYAALLHDIGKIAVDLHVELADGSVWHPWHGPLRQPYRFRYRDDREYRLHSAATGLLYRQLLDRDLLDWLSGYPHLWAPLLYVLAGQYEHAGVLGELVVQADRASVAQELGGDPARAMTAPKHSLQRKLVNGLRYLLKEELKLNQPEASDGWLTEDTLWLVSKTVSDKLRAHLLSQGVDGIPANNTAVFNVLQDHGMLQPTPDDKAIWRATVTSSTGWTHSFTLLRLAPALIWEPGERPAPFAGAVVIDAALADKDADPAVPTPVIVAMPAAENQQSPLREDASGTDGTARTLTTQASPDALEDMLAMVGMGQLLATPQDVQAISNEVPSAHADASSLLVPPAPVSPPAAASPPSASSPSGEHFMAWLRQGIFSRRLIINDAKALVHTVSDTAYLVSPGVFQRYAQEHPQVGTLAKLENQQDWQWVQKRFERLQLHRKQPNGLNIWTCEVTGPRKSRRLHGYLLLEPRSIFSDELPNNPFLKLA
ncbi:MULTISPECIES: MobH family relaxase [Pseudomonas]|jgi:integrating conjugative element relaxase (TIGR03760 family)|uniref:MobH family relaxase n=1 Tax=Pseudomonas TaxID=286 RepID=UPI0006585227|nr:MobH family relaxase [Pseudomonas aeruginosa]MBO3071645.1 TraI domain-containing protein [Pseudomonas aeruginosa]MDC0848597.1 helicase/relaxase domain-containing protein [Pseudomonas aeruginosa]PWH91205.1 relaxase [Pseudomonas aeruginosa]CRN78026.1 integrating conjugative element relaxase, PFGI-1 class [Pseudomonas aeruginosa]HCE7975022.1 TraI domain-containing protein [Pseudomonas aeruginosa]